jgi:hypothetical protein
MLKREKTTSEFRQDRRGNKDGRALSYERVESRP